MSATPNRNCPIFHRLHATPVLRAVAAACLAITTASAQDSVRPSAIAGQTSDTREQQLAVPRSQFIRLGPVDVNTSAQMQVEFTDNVGLSEVNRKSDVIFRPGLNVEAAWRATRLNTIRLNLGMSYAQYLRNPELNTQTLLLDPGSQLAFDVYVGEHLRLNFHDRILITQNPIDEATLSDIERFGRILNAAGVTAFFRFPDVELTLCYDHFTYHSLSSAYSYMNRSEEQFVATAQYRLSEAFAVGVESSAGIINYYEDINNSGTTWTTGVFAEAVISDYTRLRAAAGYQNMSFDDVSPRWHQHGFSGWYANLTAAQRITQYLSHSVAVGREARLGLDVNFADYIFARYNAVWRMNYLMTWNLTGFVEQADELASGALVAENAFRWGASASLEWNVADRTTLGLFYQFVKKDSNQPLQSYYQNLISMTLNYQF